MAKSSDLDALKKATSNLIAGIDARIPLDPKSVRAQVRALAAIVSRLDELALKKLPGSRFGVGASDRILNYLKLFVGQVIDGDELRVVSGIQEFARRVRELKIESGYDIVSGLDFKGIRPNQYILRALHPDTERAERWRISNQIRKMPGSSEGRVLAYLQARVGQIVESHELLYVAKKKDYDRRARALRSEKGWRIRTRYTGATELTPTQYMLESLEQLPEHDRKIPDDVYDRVLNRDGRKCVKCGWGAANSNPASKAQILQVHHKKLHSKGGTNEEGNLVTLCNVHHVEVHRKDVDHDAFETWLRK